MSVTEFLIVEEVTQIEEYLIMGREAYLDMRDRKLGGIREKELHDK